MTKDKQQPQAMAEADLDDISGGPHWQTWDRGGYRFQGNGAYEATSKTSGQITLPDVQEVAAKTKR